MPAAALPRPVRRMPEIRSRAASRPCACGIKRVGVRAARGGTGRLGSERKREEEKMRKEEGEKERDKGKDRARDVDGNRFW